MVWKEIGKHCTPVTVGGRSLYRTERDAGGRCWVIGSYRDLRVVAPLLRVDADLREALAALDPRFGLRAMDVPPTGARVPRIGPLGAPKFSAEQAQQHFGGLRSGDAGGKPFRPRVTDLHPEHKRFWESRTLEAHHIVEKSILGTLGVNTGDLDNRAAPCVLVCAEMHQRLYTATVAAARGSFTGKHAGGQATARLSEIYDELYRVPETAALRTIAGIIIQDVDARLSKT